ncbi:MAG: phosphoribosylformylglycinamidine synthase subunit PurQ [Bacteroidales bacterium]|jgi:phosphoribosylformylglycinamidine synthase|nr:phosphoribosylformylglycinamidine synthase subunit PurQ [Bacteroidales bacterium]
MKKPFVLIPVFPVTNTEYDLVRAFEEAGAEVKMLVFRTLNEKEIENSFAELAAQIQKADILALTGSFSANDEPNSSGAKFMANVLNNSLIKIAVEQLLIRNGLILGINNGFQALVKVGLLPFGKFTEPTPESPTLFRNESNDYISKIVQTVVSSANSPWLSSFQTGEVHQIAISHSEGKFVVNDEIAKQLFENQQIAFQYCDFYGKPSVEPEHNPNGSCFSIEGLISPCGKILGKMGHSERKGDNLYKNICGNKSQDIFRNAVGYFNL